MKAIPGAAPPEWMLDPCLCESCGGWVELAYAFVCDDGPELCSDCAPQPDQAAMSGQSAGKYL